MVTALSEPLPVQSHAISASRRSAGRWLVIGACAAFAALLVVQLLHAVGWLEVGFATWRPVLYAYALWAVAIGASGRCSCCPPSSSPSRW